MSPAANRGLGGLLPARLQFDRLIVSFGERLLDIVSGRVSTKVEAQLSDQ